MDLLSQDIKYLKGVGPVRAGLLERELGVHSLEDLVYQFPYKYIDRTQVHTVASLCAEMSYVQLRGRILSIETEGTGRKRRLKAMFTDGTGCIALVWFNGITAVERSLRVDRVYLILGKPMPYGSRFSIVHPEMDDAKQAAQLLTTLQPHYHTTDRMKRAGLTSHTLADYQRAAFSLLADHIPETLPPHLLAAQHLSPLAQSLHTVHFPASSAALPEARRRLKFEELFFLQLDILRRARRQKQTTAGFYFPRVGEHFLRFYHELLPFPLTGAQQRVVREIRADFTSGRQMNRLLQGDVGSGKTLVALLVALLAADNGFQTCLMAPTEILAEQHLATLREFAGDLPLRIALLTGNVKGRARRKVLEQTAAGHIDILVGTHALVEPSVQFHNLGLAIIDEQHRFGVKQRAALWQKNVQPPHILVMTATPIPRTLAMTAYGDLDVSIIDQLPPGRKPVLTLHYTEADRARLFAGMHAELAAGRQIYVVYPLIEESEKTDMKDLEHGVALLREAFPQYLVGFVHGRMRPADKDAAMQAFKQRETHILVSTTVIEVGVNVPNASVMVIESAERFGLSQLHQLRGRVGRGSDKSYCLLVTRDKLSETTARRIQAMVDTNNGFEIAEEDMRLRGPGDIEGTAQSGIPFDLHIADILRDTALMAQARAAAAALLDDDPTESAPHNAMIWERLRYLHRRQENFSGIS